MARRQVAQESSDDEGIVQPAPKNKENRTPAFSLTTNAVDQGSSEKEVPAAISAKQQAASKRKPAAGARAQSAASSKVGRKVLEKKARQEEEEEEDEEAVKETQDSGDEEMEQLQAGKKGGKKAAAKEKKGKVVDEETEEEAQMSPREKRMQAKLELTSSTLKAVQTAFEQLKELRTTRAEESERALADIAADRQATSITMIQNYKSENDALKAELSQLRLFPSAASQASQKSPTRSAAVGDQDVARASRLEESVARLDEQNQRLQEEVAKLRAEAGASKEKREAEERKHQEERDRKWEKQLAKTVKAKDEEAAKENGELRLDLATVRQELEAEIQHSKSIQAKLKTAPAASAPGSSLSLAQQKLQEDFDELKVRADLVEDLTGFSVITSKRENGETTFNCILNDLHGRLGGLNFKLSFIDDGSVCYYPDVNAERDQALFEVLPSQYTTFMRFDASLCCKWFGGIFNAVNKRA